MQAVKYWMILVWIKKGFTNCLASSGLQMAPRMIIVIMSFLFLDCDIDVDSVDAHFIKCVPSSQSMTAFVKPVHGIIRRRKNMLFRYMPLTTELSLVDNATDQIISGTTAYDAVMIGWGTNSCRCSNNDYILSMLNSECSNQKPFNYIRQLITCIIWQILESASNALNLYLSISNTCQTSWFS